MQKGVKTRLIIYEILKELINTSYSYDELLLKKLFIEFSISPLKYF